MAALEAGAVELCVHCLQTLVYSVDGDARKAAEQQLEAGVHHAGFASTLATLATDGPQCDLGVRQLAAVLLKQVIQKHWAADAPKFEQPELSRDERAHVQSVLPSGLAHESSKLRTAVAMCIAAIAKTDSEGWPGLIENLVGAIHTQRANNTPLVHGAIRCLSLLSDDIDEQQLPKVAEALLPELHKVAADAGGGTPEELRAAALSIFNDVLHSLGVMAGVYQRQVRDLLVPLVEPWLPLLCGVVAQPLSVEDSSGWAVRMLCLKSLTQLISFFSKPLQHHMQAAMQVCWRMYTESLALYQSHLVLEPSEGGQAGDEGEGLPCEVDSEGNTLDLESLLAQLFELLMALVGLSRYARLIRPALPEMAHLVVAYMQMTARQAAEWVDNASQYVADEDDSMFTVRVSGELLVDSLLQAFGLDAAGAVMDAVERRMAEAEAARAAGQAGWWKLREAALLAAGCCMASFPGGLADGDEGGGGGGGARQRAAAAALTSRLQGVVDEVLRADLQGPSVNPLLVGRAMWLAARLQPVLRPNQRPALLAAAAAGLNSGLPPPVKIGACRALASLVSRVPPSVLSPLAEQLYGGLLGLLAASSEDALNLVLESMVPLIRADPAAAARALPALSTPVLQVWSRFVADPLVSESALDVLAALARVPACLVPLAQQALPVISGVVRRPAEQPDGLVEGCLGLLAKLVRPGQPDVVAAVAASCTGPLLALLPGGAWQEVDDSSGSITHAATGLLVELLRAGREDLLSWAVPSLQLPPPPPSPPSPGLPAALSSPPPSAPSAPSTPSGASPDAVFAALLGACHRLLDPAADEYLTCLGGDLAHALVACLPSRAAVQPALGGLLEGCCRKLVASNVSPLVGGLVAALSHMAVAGGAAGWVEALAGLQVQVPGADGAAATSSSALQAVLPIMMERQSCVRSGLAAKTACLALLEILRTRHPLLMSFTVRGKRQDLSGGVRTRKAAAAAGGEQWTQVPAAVKMVAVVAELMLEQPWAGQDGDDGTDDDDDFDDGDEDEGFEDEDGEEGGEEDDDEDLAGDGGRNGSGGDGGGGGAGGMGLDLSLAGKHINQQEQASLDAHINRSPTLPADSAVVAGYHAAGPSAAAAATSAAAAAAAAAEAAALGPLAALDLAAALGEALRSLQSAPDTAPLLAAAVDLLPPRRQEQVAEALARGGGAGGV